MSRYVIGLDVGGGGGRSLLLDVEKGSSRVASRSWRFEPAPDTAGLGFDLDLDGIWRGLAEATRELLARASVSPADVVGISTTAIRLGTVLLDADGAVLFAVPNRDARAVGPGLGLAVQHGEALHRCTGRWPYPIHTAARLQWLAAERPALLARARSVLGLSDWLAFRLCGERASEPTQASETLLFDVSRRRWSDEWIARLGIERSWLPPLAEPGSRLGALTREAAEAFGLRAGTCVAVGGADSQCGLLGAGALDAGDVAAVAGTTTPVQWLTDAPVLDPQARVWTGCHLLPDRWLIESNAGPNGETLDWFARLMFPDSPDPVLRLLAEASDSEPGARGLLSSLGAEVMNARALGLPVGSVTLTHLTSADEPTPRRHLLRALVEGMACSLRANLEQLAEVAGGEHSPLRLTGGLARSETFARVLAGVLGAPLQRASQASASALGAALCAAVGGGAFSDLREATTRVVGRLPSIEPDPAERGAYHGLYERWRVLRDARSAADATAAQLAMPFALAAGRERTEQTGAAPRLRILVAADLDEDSLAALRELGEVEYASFRQRMRMLSGPALVESLAGCSVFVTEIDLVDARSMAQLPDLRVVVSCRGDAVNVDVAACSAFGIPVLNAPGRNADAVADLALAFLLMLARKLPQADRFLREPGMLAGDMGAMGRAFSTLQGRELWHKTVGLVGLGAVGRQVARRLRGFGARVLVHDPFVSAEHAARVDATVVPLADLLEQSDFVSLHAAVTPETAGLIGASELARMKPGACLVNTARAALVDEPALLAALQSGALAGAALDTFAVEPPGSDHPLLALERVIATPHVGGNTAEVAVHQGEIVIEDLRRLLAGARPRFVLNPEVLAGFRWTGPRPQPSPERLAALERAPAPAVSDLQKERKRADASAETAPAAANVPSETRERMNALLADFVARIVADRAVRTFAASQDVTLHFVLTDLATACHFHLGPGDALQGRLGDPARPADVQLRMRAAVLDGMFTGTANAMEAAMDGRLSFTGDAAKAMTLQHMQSDLERLYKEARAHVGVPSDLEALPTPAGGGATSPSARPAGSSDLRDEIVATVSELYGTGVITATGGNVSARIGEADEIWITPSRLFKGDLAPEVMVRIDLEGRSLDPGARSPSSEWDMHCAIYRARPEVRAVIHAHAPHATVLANTGLPFLPVSTEAAFFGEIPRVPFVMPGTHDLARAVAEAMGEGWAVLMVNHGMLVAGRSLRRAADMVEIIERSAEVILGCHAVGQAPSVLPPDVVARLRKMGDLIA